MPANKDHPLFRQRGKHVELSSGDEPARGEWKTTKHRYSMKSCHAAGCYASPDAPQHIQEKD